MLACEKLGKTGVVAMCEAPPFRHGCYERGCTFAGFFLGSGELAKWGAVPVDVKVFVQDVDEEVEKFFGVLLPVAGPFFVQAGT